MDVVNQSLTAQLIQQRVPMMAVKLMVASNIDDGLVREALACPGDPLSACVNVTG